MSSNVERRDTKSFLDLDNNKKNIDKLLMKIKSPIGIVPFIGAGMSIPFGYKGWKDFLTFVAHEWGVYEQLEKLFEESKYEEIADKLINIRNRLYLDDEVKSEYNIEKIPNKQQLNASAFLIPAITKKIVITTNFDQVLEKIFSEQNKGFEFIIKGPFYDAITKAIDSDKMTLIKIHGDIDETTNRIFSSADYDLSYNQNRSFPNLLKKLLSTYTFVFFGCSLTIDRILKVMEDIAQQVNSIHFAFLLDPDSKQKRTKRTNELSKFNIIPIWYPGTNHDLLKTSLETIISMLDKGRPSTEMNGQNIFSKFSGLQLTEDERNFLTEIYIKQNIENEGILKSDLDTRLVEKFENNSLLKENQYYKLSVYKTTNLGSEYAHLLIINNLNNHQSKIEQYLERIPKNMLIFFYYCHISRKTTFDQENKHYSGGVLENIILSSNEVWNIWSDLLTFLVSINLCYSAHHYVSTRGGETREIAYVLPKEFSSLIRDIYNFQEVKVEIFRESYLNLIINYLKK